MKNARCLAEWFTTVLRFFRFIFYIEKRIEAHIQDVAFKPTKNETIASIYKINTN